VLAVTITPQAPTAPGSRARAARSPRAGWAAVAGLVLAGLVLRAIYADQSLNADELSTHWIVVGSDPWGVLSAVHTDAEITPPLYFELAWLASLAGDSAGWLRLPSLLAGLATIPLVYAIGLRTVGRRAALLAAVLTALSPFMVFYSAEARAYALMMALVAGSTLALLIAAEDGRKRWWALYAACCCAAMYTHYTSAFALAGQLAWLLWFHPRARRPALVATAAAALAFLPWAGGLRGDLNSRTTEILSALQPSDLHSTVVGIAHWVIGYPYAAAGSGLRDLPGLPALLLLAVAVAVAAVALAADRRALAALRTRGFALVAVLALSVPVCEALFSAIGTNVLSTRNLAAGWPGLALALAAVLAAPRARAALVAPALAVAAFAIAGIRLLDGQFQRPDYRAAAALIDARARPGDSVIDAADLAPVGVPGSLEITFERPHRVYEVGRADARYDPFRIVAWPEPTPDVVNRAAAAAARGRVFVLLVDGHPRAHETLDAMPPRFRRVATWRWPGSTRLALVEYEDQTATGA
jgi:hypothetical protein